MDTIRLLDDLRQLATKCDRADDQYGRALAQDAHDTIVEMREQVDELSKEKQVADALLRLTIQQRDAAWRENERLQRSLSMLRIDMLHLKQEAGYNVE